MRRVAGLQHQFNLGVLRRQYRKRALVVDLVDGQLLVMAGETQRHWHHALMKSAAAKTRRINLTFRHIRP